MKVGTIKHDLNSNQMIKCNNYIPTIMDNVFIGYFILIIYYICTIDIIKNYSIKHLCNEFSKIKRN